MYYKGVYIYCLVKKTCCIIVFRKNLSRFSQIVFHCVTHVAARPSSQRYRARRRWLAPPTSGVCCEPTNFGPRHDHVTAFVMLTFNLRLIINNIILHIEAHMYVKGVRNFIKYSHFSLIINF